MKIYKEYTRLTLKERHIIEYLISKGKGVRFIATELDRSPGTISREISKNKKRSGDYNAVRSHTIAERTSKTRNNVKKMDKNNNLLTFVKVNLSLGKSPEKISKLLKIHYPDDDTMQISHESIYNYMKGVHKTAV